MDSPSAGQAGSSNDEEAIALAKEEDGGAPPSELFLKSNEELSKMLHDLSGKVPPPRTSKKRLIKRIERLTQPAAAVVSKGLKRKPEDDDVSGAASAPNPNKVQKVGSVLPELSAVQISEMKKVLSVSVETLYTHRELLPMWDSIGMTLVYPVKKGKDIVLRAMKDFATRNLAFHKIE